MGTLRKWWCKVADFALWPVVKAIGLTLMIFTVIVAAMLIGWATRWLWFKLF